MGGAHQVGAVSQRHVPERTCIACRRKTAKGDLIRLVCAAGGGVEIDRTGKQRGRGAYLCGFRDCWESALKGNRLEHSLKSKIDAESRLRLAEYGQTLPKRDS